MTDELRDLVVLDIPESPPRELGFLDISGQSTRETAICRVYAHFLDAKRSPQISALLSTALLNLIEQEFKNRTSKTVEQKELDMDQFKVEYEVATSSKHRIDLVLQNNAGRSVVIIEAKIFHKLGNPLHSYWNHYDYPPNRKAGVVLSLERMPVSSIRHDHFVNITHTEWLNATVAMGLPHDLPIKDFIYFKDFINNMNHLSTTNEMTPELSFYLKHADKIEKAIKTKQSAFQFVIQQLEKAAIACDLKMFGSNDEWKHINSPDRKSPIYFTVLPQKILTTGGRVSVILELGSAAVKREKELKGIQQKYAHSKGINELSQGNSFYRHYLISTIEINPDSFGQLSQKVCDILNGPLGDARKEMLAILSKPNTPFNEV